MPSSEYTVNILIKSKDQTSAPAKTASKSMLTLANAAQLAAAGFVVLRAAQKGLEFIKLGASVQAARDRLIKFAGGTAKADELLRALNKSSDNTLDRMTAMTTASTLFSLGLATTAKDMGVAGAMLGRLARSGLGAEGAMNSLTMLLANQSKRRLDDFSLSVEEVTTRQKDLEAQGLSTEEAFKTAVFDTASAKLAILGDTSQLAGKKIGRLEASLKTLGQVVAEGVALQATEGGVLDALADGTNAWTGMIEALIITKQRDKIEMRAYVAALKAGATEQEAVKAGVDAVTASLEEQNKVLPDISGQMMVWEDATKLAAKATREADTSTEDFFTDMANAPATLGKYADSVEWLTERIDEQAEATEEARSATAAALLDATMDWTSFYKGQADNAADFADDKEGIEQEHADNLAEIAEQGQAKSIWINETAEQTKLDDLQRNLKIALLDQADFTEKTKEQQHIRKEAQIAKLQEGIAAQQSLLDTFRAGRLIKAGEDTTALLAEEQTRYDLELGALKVSQEEQETAQRESLGRMMLQQFDTWAGINKFTGERADEMRTAIALEYGLIDEAGARSERLGTLAWKTYMDNVTTSATEIVKVIGSIKTAMDEIPREITTEFRAIGGDGVFSTGMGTGENEGGMASGGTARGGDVWVGELGPERVRLPRGSQVTPASQTTKNYTFNQTVNTRATQHSITDDFALAEAMAA